MKEKQIYELFQDSFQCTCWTFRGIKLTWRKLRCTLYLVVIFSTIKYDINEKTQKVTAQQWYSTDVTIVFLYWTKSVKINSVWSRRTNLVYAVDRSYWYSLSIRWILQFTINETKWYNPSLHQVYFFLKRSIGGTYLIFAAVQIKTSKTSKFSYFLDLPLKFFLFFVMSKIWT